ncbi:MAG TPA: hypothetical protein VH333_11385 [Pseudonocardiaceae bacterium]|jgi:hypothetical protein|nr:hypothetical protein [Pseudonocardiaceae bacterium]
MSPKSGAIRQRYYKPGDVVSYLAATSPRDWRSWTGSRWRTAPPPRSGTNSACPAHHRKLLEQTGVIERAWTDIADRIDRLTPAVRLPEDDHD